MFLYWDTTWWGVEVPLIEMTGDSATIPVFNQNEIDSNYVDEYISFINEEIGHRTPDVIFQLNEISNNIEMNEDGDYTISLCYGLLEEGMQVENILYNAYRDLYTIQDAVIDSIDHTKREIIFIISGSYIHEYIDEPIVFSMFIQ